MTKQRDESNVELVVCHSSFRTTGDLVATCACGWSHRGRQSAVTSAARRHVQRNLDHEVWTERVQQKITRARRTTVLR